MSWRANPSASARQSMRVTVNGELPAACTAKDLILALIGKIGTGGGTGHVIEYTGPAIRRSRWKAA